VTRPLLRRAGRGLNPAGLILAGVCFALPFVTVACDIPGGYGRAAPGGTTTYTGFDLVIGGEPAVAPADKIRPLPPGHDDELPPQPAAIAVLVLLVGAAGVALTVAQPRLRRGSLAVLTGVAATALLVNQALVEAEIAVRVGEQLTQPPAAGKAVRDYVDTGPGFVAGLALLVALAVVNGIGWIRTRQRTAPVDPEPTLRL
jgi:hypothetical protein